MGWARGYEVQEEGMWQNVTVWMRYGMSLKEAFESQLK